MYTISYQNMLKEIKDKIENQVLLHKNSLIIGDNSSGKSEILKILLQGKSTDYYFIDSVNRSFDYEKVSKNIIDEGDNSVLAFRLEDNNFNLRDTFNYDKTGMGKIEDIYFEFESELKEMLNGFLGIDFDIKLTEDELFLKKYKLVIGEAIEKLSSGYQAIVRLFLELLYFNKYLKSSNDCCVVVIDEVNEFLSAKNEAKILPYITNKFKDIIFVVTTHSADVIASSIDFNLIVLTENNYEILDANDYFTTTDVREIFEKIYNLDRESDSNNIDITLRSLLSAKISDSFTEVEARKLKIIEELSLTTAQKLILNQIKSW